jgi:hypothetical protein
LPSRSNKKLRQVKSLGLREETDDRPEYDSNTPRNRNNDAEDRCS